MNGRIREFAADGAWTFPGATDAIVSRLELVVAGLAICAVLLFVLILIQRPRASRLGYKDR